MSDFKKQDNTMVITTKNVIAGIKPVLFVSHDSEDGMWEFLDGEELDENEACIVSLAEILEIDGSLGVLHDLPLGWIAYRNYINDTWNEERIKN